MSERLTWEEIQERYPDQWVGLKKLYWHKNVEGGIIG